MFEGTKAWAAIQSTQGGILRARRQHGMQEPPEAYNTIFANQKHTCVHIMKNKKCSGFEATARVAMLYWAKSAPQEYRYAGINELGSGHKDSVIMALSRMGSWRG